MSRGSAPSKTFTHQETNTGQRANNNNNNNKRGKVLCLGMSFAELHVDPSENDTNKNGGRLQRVVAAVQTRQLSEIDGRDTARCIATEETCHVDVYTVSQEQGGQYRADRHLRANFNRSYSLIQSLKEAFPGTVFDQIILDYYWIPTGWDVAHWKRSFFDQVLPAFVEKGLLKRPQVDRHVWRSGVIYLPFCLHVFSQVVACWKKLQQYYNVRFVKRRQMEEICVWKGTRQIEPTTMQRVFGKRIDQEEIYCTFTIRDLMEVVESAHVTRAELISIMERIENVNDVRFIALETLPFQAARTRRGGLKEPKGQYLGLLPKTKPPPSRALKMANTIEKCKARIVTPTPVKRRVAPSRTSIQMMRRGEIFDSILVTSSAPVAKCNAARAQANLDSSSGTSLTTEHSEIACSRKRRRYLEMEVLQTANASSLEAISSANCTSKDNGTQVVVPSLAQDSQETGTIEPVTERVARGLSQGIQTAAI